MKSKHLKYGSLITLSTTEDYYLYSQGFIDSSPYLRLQSQNFSNFCGSIFRIVPQCMHTVQSNIVHFIKDLREIDFTDKIAQLVKMEESLDGEIKTNLHSYNTYKEQVIKYNSFIQLEHFTSHKFLTLRSQLSAEAEKDNFKLTFEDFPSDYSHFRIVPSFKFQKQGSGKVKLSDKVYLQITVPELRKVAWMHSSKGLNLDLVVEDLSLCDPNERISKAIEVNVSLDQKTRWNLKLYGEIPNDNKSLSCSDYIWLHSPETHSTIVFHNKLTSSTVKNDTNGLWMIEFEDSSKGGPVFEDKRYRLRHVVTGKYLSIKDSLCLSKKQNKHSLWKFISFKSTELIHSDSLCYLIHDASNFTIKAAENLQLSYIVDEHCICKPSKADPDVVWEILFLLHCYPVLEGFPGKYVEAKELVENSKGFHEFRKYCGLVRACLADLRLFVRNRLQSMIGIDTHSGEVQHMRQVILKQQGFFEALTGILECVESERLGEKSGQGNKGQNFSPLNFAQMVSEIYTLLIQICDRNQETQEYAYKFVRTYTKHVGLELGATDLILAILRNNESLMLKIHQNPEFDLLTFYSQRLLSLTGFRTTECIDFLKAICLFKGEAVSVNQEKVFETVVLNKAISKKALIKTTVDDEKLTIKLEINKKTSLDQCFEYGRIIGFEPEIKYFTTLLQLYSNLCAGRNFESSNHFVTKFSFKVLKNSIWNSDLTIEIRAAFCRLLFTVYVDCAMREEVEKPQLIKEMKKSSERSSIELRASKRISVFELESIKALKESEEEMEELFERIFEYFGNANRIFENLFTLEILQMAFKLIKFESFSHFASSVKSNDSLQSGKLEDSRIVKIIKAVSPILYDCKSGGGLSHTTSNLTRKNKKHLKKVSNESRQTYMKYLSSIIKDTNSMNDPVIRSASNLKNYLNIFKQNPFNGLEKKTISHKIKLKITKILEYFLDSRQEFLLNNLLEWVQSLNENTPEESDVFRLLPSVIIAGELEEIKVKVKNSKLFKCLDPILPNLQRVTSSEFIFYLLKVLTNCDNYKLQTKVLSIIFRCFDQRRELLKNIKKVHVVFDEHECSIIKWVKNNLLNFKYISEKSEIWMNYWKYDQVSLQSKHQDVFFKAIEILQNIEKFLYEDMKITENGPTDSTAKKLSKSRQEVLNYLNVPKVIITLIKDGEHKLATLYKSDELKTLHEPCKLLHELFESCYRVLKKIVMENSKNQKQVHKYLHVLTQHLYLPLGQIPLICEIFRNNLQLVNTITESTVNIFKELIVEYGRQAEFLKVFDVIQTTNGKPNHVVQRLVLSLFIKEKINPHMLYMVSEEDFSFDYKKKNPKNYFYKDQPFEYHAGLLTVLAKCGLGAPSKTMNEIKCQNIINLKNLFEILNLCEHPKTPFACLKGPALDFFYHIYIDTGILNLELKSFSGFFEYIHKQSSVIDKIREVSLEFIEFLEIWIEILSSYRAFYIKKVHSSYYEQTDIRALRTFCEVLSRNAFKFVGKLSPKLQEAISQLCNLFEESFEVESDSEEFLVTLPDYKRAFTTVSSSINTSVQDRHWNNIRTIFRSHKDLKELIKQEDFSLIYTIFFCERVKNTTNFENVIRTLIAYIRVSRSQRPPIGVLVKVVELIEKIIANPLVVKESELQKEKTEIQYKMSFYGLTNVILVLMSDALLEKQVFKALLSLSVQLLDGGNTQIQQEFYRYFLTHSNSEVFFLKIFKIFHSKIEKIAELRVYTHSPKPVYKEKKSLLKILLRFLQLLCENHNHLLQNYLRLQEKSAVNHNLVSTTVDLLRILMKKFFFFHFHIISQCFDSLTEFIQGPCFENQVEIVNGGFLEVASELLSIDENFSPIQNYTGLYFSQGLQIEEDSEESSEPIEELTGWMIAHLKNKCLITIISLFEGRKDNFVSTRLTRSLNLEILQENLKGAFLNYIDYYKSSYFHYSIFNHAAGNENYDLDSEENPQDTDPKFYTAVIENGFLVYHLIRILQDNDDPEHLETLNNQLNTISALAQSSKHEAKPKRVQVMNERQIRDSIVSLKCAPSEQEEKDAQYWLSSAYKFFGKHTGNIEVVFNGEIYRVYFYYPPEYKGLNNSIKGMFHRKANRESDQSKLKYMLDSVPEIFALIKHEFALLNLIKRYKIVGVVANNIEPLRKSAFLLTLVLNFLILISFDTNREYLSIYTLNHGDKGLGQKQTQLVLSVLGITQLVLCLLILAFFLFKVGPYLAKKGWEKRKTDLFQLHNHTNLFVKTLITLIQVLRTIFYVLSDFDVIYYLLYTLFSVFGIALHPFYYSLLLLDVFYRAPLLQNVVKSIILPRKALSLTFLLILVIVYIWAILGYWLFYEDYYIPDCHSLLQCLLTVWDQSFKNNGGIGGFLPYPPTPYADTMRFFYDNVYNILVMIVLMGVVQGIIIDTFARLREEQEFCKSDMENKCFVCGLQRDYIEKHTAKGFLHHVKSDHNEWNYVLFIAYLMGKESTEYSGIESYVREQVDKDELVWIPNQASLAIKIEKEDCVAKGLEEISEALEMVQREV